MTHSQRKSVEELLTMSSADVRAYLQTLSASEQKVISRDLYRAQLSLDLQKNQTLQGESHNKML